MSVIAIRAGLAAVSDALPMLGPIDEELAECCNSLSTLLEGTNSEEAKAGLRYALLARSAVARGAGPQTVARKRISDYSNFI